MQSSSLSRDVFWREAAISVVTLVALVGAAWAAPGVFARQHGRLPATTVGIMRSRAVLYNPGVTGYYERLFGTPNFMFMSDAEYERLTSRLPDVIYDHSFRIRHFRKNLKNLRSSGQPQGLTTNSVGFLGPERSFEKAPGTRRIAVLGDSIAQGWGADQNHSFASVLENKLNANSPKDAPPPFEVLNFAARGYVLTQTLDVAEEEVPRFHPDICLLALTELAVSRNWDEHFTRVIQLGIDPKYDFLKETIKESGVSRTDPALTILGKLAPYRMSVVRGALSAIKAREAQDHVAFFVVLVPTLEDGSMAKNRFAGIRELLASLDIPVVDLLNTFDRFLDVEPLRINPFDVHPNVRGHALIAQNLYNKLRARPDLWADLQGPLATASTAAIPASAH